MRPRVLAVLIPVAILVAACSAGAKPSTAPSSPSVAVATPTASPIVAPTASRTVVPTVQPVSGDIPVVLSDTMRFAPDPIVVKAGEKVRFLVKNEGVAVHEFFVGSEEEQAEHAAEMAMGRMSHGHDNALSLKGGESGSLSMTFAKAGSLLVGCHEPGHYEAGMKATLTVVE